MADLADVLTRQSATRIRAACQETAAAVHRSFGENIDYLVKRGMSHQDAVAQVTMALRPWVAELVDRRDALIAQEEEHYQEAIRNLLSRWSQTHWITDSARACSVDTNPARPSGPLLEDVISRVLPAPLARRRVDVLRGHADAVVQLRQAHQHVWEEMLGREVRVMVQDGLRSHTAKAAARANLAIRKRKLDAELGDSLDRLSAELLRKLQRLTEDAEGEQ